MGLLPVASDGQHVICFLWLLRCYRVHGSCMFCPSNPSLHNEVVIANICGCCQWQCGNFNSKGYGMAKRERQTSMMNRSDLADSGEVNNKFIFKVDPEIHGLLEEERSRQLRSIELS